MFCYPENIGAEMQKLFSVLAGARYFHDLSSETFAQSAARFLSELNAIHPFREGNGRTQLVFLTLLSERAGRPLDLARMDPQKMLAAMVRSFVAEESGLKEIIASLLTE